MRRRVEESQEKLELVWVTVIVNSRYVYDFNRPCLSVSEANKLSGYCIYGIRGKKGDTQSYTNCDTSVYFQEPSGIRSSMRYYANSTTTLKTGYVYIYYNNTRVTDTDDDGYWYIIHDSPAKLFNSFHLITSNSYFDNMKAGLILISKATYKEVTGLDYK